jgi:tetratricopeptide (TPR) repeat protein
VEKLTPLYERWPTNPDVAINLGGANILLRKWNRAVRILRHAAEAHPQNAMLWTNLAAAELGRLETAGPQQMTQALDAYARAVEADPQVPHVHYHMGLIYKEQGALQQAAASFQLALAVNPADGDARYWLERLSQSPARSPAPSEIGGELDAADGVSE